ncbi:MAG: peptide deformylase [Deltaproteobacteria bacterium]|nr:peptide deformylase [Deltaproteobacteria bacterium]
MKRRDLLKFGLLSVFAAAGGTGFLKLYKYNLGVRKITEYPAPILRKVSTPVEVIDDKIVSLSHQMISTLRYNLLNRGLSAPQVGVPKRLIVCGLYGEIKVLINPEIVEKRGAYYGYETCLSLPYHDRKIINRPGFVKVKFRGLDDTELEAAKGYAALLTHEIDHLNGTLFIDYKDENYKGRKKQKELATC